MRARPKACDPSPRRLIPLVAAVGIVIRSAVPTARARPRTRTCSLPASAAAALRQNTEGKRSQVSATVRSRRAAVGGRTHRICECRRGWRRRPRPSSSVMPPDPTKPSPAGVVENRREGKRER
ncbi:unnamed protein product, partial [Musa acuminata subsp. burmannicoides]